VIDLLKKECGLASDTVIADVASGTGIFSRMLLENGNQVVGVEPNADMRKAGEEFLQAYPNFTSVEGTAEATSLADQSVDLITAAQAAHWFDRQKARQEFLRILKSGGWTVLLWNERRLDSTPFLRDYEQLLLTYSTDYETVRHERTTQEMGTFFSPSAFQVQTFEYQQLFDYAGLEGRLLSSSYTPEAGSAGYSPMLQELRQIFDAHQRDGRVSFDYDTLVFFGRLHAGAAQEKTGSA
jgi:ubiquinone/menaquinone biosynthesis C-methylase UbiE